MTQPPAGEGSTEIIASGPDAGKVRFTPSADFFGGTSFNYTISDGDGGTDTANVTVNLNPVNDAPVNSVPGTQNINEDQARVFSAANSNLISISDPDAGSDDVKVTLTADHGKLTLGGLAGLLFTSGDGTGDATMTFTGPIPAVNAALNLLTFAPDANYDGSDAKLTILTNDQGNNGSGGENSDTDSVNVTVVNVAPAATFDAAPNTIDEGQDINLSLTSVVDPGTLDTHEYAFKCGDGDWSGFGSSNTASCPTSDNGRVIVKGQVRDEDGGRSDIYEKTVTVNNVAPKVVLSGPTQANEGDTKTYSFTITDPGDDEQTVDWDCGDNGEKVDVSFSYDPATKTGSFECRFPDGPTETDVSVTVNDGDGSGSDSITVNVANVAPTANDNEMNTTELVSVTSNLLDNDNDLDAASLKILDANNVAQSANGPANGLVTIGNLLDGNVSYLPTAASSAPTPSATRSVTTTGTAPRPTSRSTSDRSTVTPRALSGAPSAPTSCAARPATT